MQSVRSMGISESFGQKIRTGIVIVLALLLHSHSLSAGAVPEGVQKIRVETDFEGGNGCLIKSDVRTNSVVLAPEKKPGDTLALNLYCVLTGFDPRRELQIHLKSPAPPRGLFVREGRKVWRQIQSDRAGRYRGRFPTGRVELATMPPYLFSDLQRWLTAQPAREWFRIVYPGKTGQGLALPVVLLTPKNAGKKTPLIVIIARQHAFEHAASWVVQGMLDFLVSNTTDARAGRNKAVFAIVPMVDIDGVRLGSTGKHLGGTDMNRSWDSPVHREQGVILDWIDGLAERYPVHGVYDIHAMGYQMPSFRFGLSLFDNTRGNPDRAWRYRELSRRFRNISGYAPARLPLPGWKNLPGMFATRMLNHWPNLREAIIVECTPWRRPDGVCWNAELIRRAGVDLARAVCRGIYG